MKYFNAYFRLYTKRAFKSYTSIFLITIVSVIGLFFTAQLLISMGQGDISKQKVRIGLVGDLTDTYLGIGFSAVEDIDESRFSIEFLELDEQAAENMLNEGDISAYLIVPDKFVDSIVNGDNMQLTFVMSETSATFSSILMSEVTNAISDIITNSESSIYALMRYSYNEKTIRDIDSKVDKLNIKYIDRILSRSDAIEMEVRGVSDSLNLIEYYVCGIVTIFLLIFGISCSVLFSEKNLPLGRLMKSRNFGVIQIVLSEYLAFLIISCLTVFILAFMAGAAAEIFLMSGNSIRNLGLVWCIATAVKLIPFIAMLAAMQFFLYEMTSGIVSGVLAQFVTAVGLGYISGCFYPYYFFPQTVQNIAAVLPSGIAFKFIRSCMSQTDSGWTMLLSVIYTVIFIGLSVMVRRRRLQRC